VATVFGERVRPDSRRQLASGLSPPTPRFQRTRRKPGRGPLSAEANSQSLRNEIHAHLGAVSAFRGKEQFFVQPVDNWTTALLPDGWTERTARIEAYDGVVAHCLAGREKDIPHVRGLLAAQVVTGGQLREFIGQVAAVQPTAADRQLATLVKVLAESPANRRQ